MPGVFVFPGGVTEEQDANVEVSADLNSECLTTMQVANQREANALAISALRETHEETGLLAGFDTHKTQHTFHQHVAAGNLPDLSKLYYFGRAVTPPVHKYRFHARFFLLELESTLPVDRESDELEDIQWLSLPAPADLPTAPVTEFMLEECWRRFQNGFSHSDQTPYFRWENEQRTITWE